MRRANNARARLATAVGLLLGFAVLAPVGGVAAASQAGALRADLNGKALELARVGSYYCQDFDYPAIHCFSTAGALEASVSPVLAAATVAPADYVIVYEFTSFQGAYMYMSQDYSILGLIGWNDRISSFRALNSQAFVFWTDWLYSGTRLAYCCNVLYTTLGGYDNTFSSVYRS